MYTAFKLLLQLMLAGLLAQAQPSLAQTPAQGDHILRKEVWLDTAGNLPLQEVERKDFSPFQGVYAGGYTPHPLWVRLVVQPAADGAPLVLRIQPSYLNAVTLYEPAPEKDAYWRTSNTGNATPWIQRPYASLSLGFTVQPQTTQTYYLRVQSISNTLLHVQALTVNEASHQEMTAILWQGLYMAIILWFILWAFHDYRLHRDPLILTFGILYLVYLTYVLAILGYFSPIFSNAQWLPQFTFFAVTLAVITSLFFHRKLLQLFDVPRPSVWLLNTLQGFSLLALLTLLAGHTSAALKLNSTIALISSPVLFLVALSARNNAAPGRFKLKLYYGLLSLFIFAYVAPILGFTAPGTWVLYGALTQGLISAILFGHLLHARSMLQLDEKNRANTMLKLSEFKVSAQKEQLQKQGQFTAMLTHELKNPLAAIHLNLDAMDLSSSPAHIKRQHRIIRALKDIDALIERCVLSDRVERNTSTPQVAAINIPDLVTTTLDHHPKASRVRVHVDTSALCVTSDEQLLGVAISNLLENALKYSPPDSNVSLRAYPLNDANGHSGVQIEVSNSPGPAGFPDTIHAFENYYRGPATSRENGSGLGLYLAQGIAQRLGGHLSYTPQNDHIIFSLWIPTTRP